MLTLLTATGCRPKAWELCERWMLAQTYGGAVRWLIVDDGREAQRVKFRREGWTIEVIRPEPCWNPGENTQARNLMAGLDKVADSERLVIIEDDDWYSASWLAKVDRELEASPLVGEGQARYYNVSNRSWFQFHNRAHASLCSTALRGTAIHALREVCKPSVKFIDIQLWQAHSGRVFDGRDVVGIKGIEGRAGIGMGHTVLGTPDPSGDVLSQWVGEDTALLFN